MSVKIINADVFDGIEVNPRDCEMARKRIEADAGLFCSVSNLESMK